MANIRKMADTGKLITAGPFENDQLRRLFFFGISSTEEARALVNEDPAVVAGRLTVDLYQWYAPAGLRVDLRTVSLADSSARVHGLTPRLLASKPCKRADTF